MPCDGAFLDRVVNYLQDQNRYPNAPSITTTKGTMSKVVKPRRASGCMPIMWDSMAVIPYQARMSTATPIR